MTINGGGGGYQSEFVAAIDRCVTNVQKYHKIVAEKTS